MENLIAELSWRGLVQDIIPGTEEQLCKESTSAYVGFDPTADSLHIGHLAVYMLVCSSEGCFKFKNSAQLGRCYV